MVVGTFALIFFVGGVLTIHYLVRTPDKDRPLAYPTDTKAWAGADSKGGLSFANLVISELFWSLVLGGTGFVATWVAMGTELRPSLALLVSLPYGFALAIYVGVIRLRSGPGMMRTVPNQKRPDTTPRTRPRVLFICGSINQSSQMHQVSQQMPEVDAYFTPYYSASWFITFGRKGLMQEYSILGYRRRAWCLEYLHEHNLKVDLHGERYDYDLVVTSSDQVMSPNILDKKIVMVQEGILEPANRFTQLCKKYSFMPRYVGGTSTTGLSHQYDYLCAASGGYRDHFVDSGVDSGKVLVTGIPNFDNCARFYENDFPHKDFVLACTSDNRETFQEDDREEFIAHCLKIANGRQLIFKLHPNEKVDRAVAEVAEYAPDALVYPVGSAEEMVANCSVLITEWSSVTFVGLALDKEVHTKYPLEYLRPLVPVQNNSAAANIASICRELIDAQVEQEHVLDPAIAMH
jgi:hypothetical protein